MSYTDPVVTAFEAALAAADHVSLLLTAEAAGSATDPSVAPAAAATAVAASIGYPLPNYDNSKRTFFQSAILTKLSSLRYLTHGPSLAVPRGNWYSWQY